MPDLAAVLNEEQPALSIHAGDVISAGGSFFPPPQEYAKQLAFAKDFYQRLSHPYMPLLGNHETLEPHYDDEAQLETWSRHFGRTYRHHDVGGWRFIGVNCLLPNPKGRYGRGDGFGNVFGMDAKQMEWLRDTLAEASARNQKAIISTHVPPVAWANAAEFEKTITQAKCVRAVLCGHTHRNSINFMGGIPILVRVANVTSPFGYTMVHCYPDGKVLLIQKSQHFPLEDFLSSSIQGPGPLGTEGERFLTVGGSTQLALEKLRVIGGEAQAGVADGHLRLTGRNERAMVLIDTAPLNQARLTLTIVKAAGERVGGIGLAGADGAGGIEAALTSRYSPDGKVYLASSGPGGREVLARNWFNIGDQISYRLTLTVGDGRITASWKNMLNLESKIASTASGHFGFFVDRGVALVTDLRLERLG